MEDDLEARFAEQTTRVARAVGITHRNRVLGTQEVIQNQMDHLHSTFQRKAIHPIRLALRSDAVHGSQGIVHIETILKLGKEHEMECSRLNTKIAKAEENSAGVVFLLDENIPGIDALKQLSDEELQELIQKWWDIEKFMRNVVKEFRGFLSEWNAMKQKFKKEVKDCIDTITVLVGDKAIAKYLG